ncbi:MAG: GWxTD domain-containing protein [Gemmatimonadaceae bacterium]|nr:GWxTD domain-containing protein [Gemmatimonadaceae bacterium]
MPIRLRPRWISLLLLPAVGLAQGSGNARADSLFQQAVALGAGSVEEVDRGIELLKQVQRLTPRFAGAYYQHGLLLSRTSQMGLGDLWRRKTAEDRFEDALKLDPDNPYYYLELGRLRLKMPFMRIEADRLFNKALRAAQRRRDGRAFAEIAWELGQIDERRYAAQVDRRLLTGSIVGINIQEAENDWHYVPTMLETNSSPLLGAGELDALKAEQRYRDALAADSTFERAAVSLIGLLYERKRIEEAARAADRLARVQPGSARVRLARGMVLHTLDREEEAAVAFDSALALLPDAERREMTTLAPILPEAQERFNATLDRAALALAERSYWDAADPVALTPVNEARNEYLARVAYADLRFSSEEFQIRGWKTDRGLIWIRYGPPPVRASFAPDVQGFDWAESLGRITSVWFYPETKLRFVFSGAPAMGLARFAGNFRAFADNARILAPVRWDNLDGRMRMDSMPLQIARFRGATPDRVEIDLYAGIPGRRLLDGLDLSPAPVEIGLRTDDGTTRAITRDTVALRRESRETLRQWTRVTGRGDLAFRAEARQPDSGRGARADAVVIAMPYSAGAFALSDVVVARRVRPRGAREQVRGDFDIVPNPGVAFARGDTLALYWESYGATLSPERTATLRIKVSVKVLAIDRPESFSAKILGGFADAVGLSAKGDEQVSISFDRTVTSVDDRIPHWLTLDLGNAPHARYRLGVTVTDLTSNRSATVEREIVLPRPAAATP